MELHGSTAQRCKLYDGRAGSAGDRSAALLQPVFVLAGYALVVTCRSFAAPPT